MSVRTEARDPVEELEERKNRKRRPVTGHVTLTEEGSEELDQAALSTQRAYGAVRSGGLTSYPEDGRGLPVLKDLLAEKVVRSREKEEKRQLAVKVAVM